MATLYPVAFPAVLIPAAMLNWHKSRGVSLTQSPFDGSQQVQAYNAQRLTVEVDLPPMSRTDAELWIVALESMYGDGTCLFGELVGAASQSPVAVAHPGSPQSNGAAQQGRSLQSMGWDASAGAPLYAGDWLQLLQNLITIPKTFNVAGWTKLNGTAADNTTTGPDGTVTAAATITPLGGGAVTLKSQLLTAGTDFPAGNHGLYGQVWFKSSKTMQLKIFKNGSAILTATNATPTGAWQALRIPSTMGSVLPTIFNAGDTLQLQIIETATGVGDVFNLWGACLALDSTSRLHKNLVKLFPPGGGTGIDNTLVELNPPIRGAMPDCSMINTVNPRGIFRLADPEGSYSIDQAVRYGLKFTLTEAY